MNIADTLLRHKIDGVIATNTTLNHHSVDRYKNGSQAGGVSGEPVFDLSNIVIRALKREMGDALPIIGVGGIMTGDDALTKMKLGASLVQLYTGFIY